tara:strand:+ start:146 stop:658 length:513 start_codon:yes stop_codon:yes gene_type:complete
MFYGVKSPIFINREEIIMTVSEKHSGGCGCGSIRYETFGEPEIAALCHCRYCQTRTGSAFGISVYFDNNNFKLLSGVLKEYKFTNNAGRTLSNYFCDKCGTNVCWKLEIREKFTGVAAGTFDPPTFWFDMDIEVFRRTKAPFLETNISEKHDTVAYYEMKIPDPIRLTGD